MDTLKGKILVTLHSTGHEIETVNFIRGGFGWFCGVFFEGHECVFEFCGFFCFLFGFFKVHFNYF